MHKVLYNFFSERLRRFYNLINMVSEEHDTGKKLKLYDENYDRIDTSKQTETREVQSGDYNDLDFIVDSLFDKIKLISGDDDTYLLPDVEYMFKDKPWKIKRLQTLKKELNDKKNLLNDFNLDEWQNHTKQRNKAGFVLRHVRKSINPEFLTQAWLKFYEIACAFELVPTKDGYYQNFTSVHLCEAPGAFIAALNHLLKTNAPTVEWDWVATTLNPYYEGNQLTNMINDDRFIRHTLNHWNFGKDNTGNIMDWENMNHLIGEVKNKDFKVLLVTADGSIDCLTQPDEQEANVAQLHYCETVTALRLLDKGGSFLIKLFTVFEQQTVCLMYLLSCLFQEVSTIKPATSKEGNSEMYVVCLKFRGQEFIEPYINVLKEHYTPSGDSEIPSMFRLQDLPEKFLYRIQECAEFYKSEQCLIIISNYATFKRMDLHERLKRIKQLVARKYIEYCDLTACTSEKLEIVGKTLLQYSGCYSSTRKFVQDSYTERSKKQFLKPNLRLDQIQKEMEDVYMIRESFVFKFKKVPEKLWITVGKTFHRINSSRFCDESIFKVRDLVDEILKDMNRSVTLPDPKTIEILREKVKRDNFYSLNFQFTDLWNSHRIIKCIYQCIMGLKTDDHLVLTGYTLLTQLNVGILHLIGCTFHETKFRYYEKVGYLIIFKRFKNNSAVLDYLKEIYDASITAKSQGMEVLTVLPISTLCDSDIYPEIAGLNHYVIKLYVDQAVKVTKLRH